MGMRDAQCQDHGCGWAVRDSQHSIADLTFNIFDSKDAPSCYTISNSLSANSRTRNFTGSNFGSAFTISMRHEKGKYRRETLETNRTRFDSAMRP